MKLDKKIVNINPNRKPNVELEAEDFVYQAYTCTLNEKPDKAVRSFMNLCILHWNEQDVIDAMYKIVRDKEEQYWFDKGKNFSQIGHKEK